MGRFLFRWAFILSAFPGVASAQSLPPGQPDLGPHSGAAPALPRIEPAPAPPSTVGPAPAPASEQKTLSTAPIFVLRAVTLVGNTVLDQAAIDKIVAPHLGRPASIASLDEIRRALTLLYIDRGYINSGVVIPDQNVENGVITMRAVEGRVTEVDVAGTKHFRPDYLRSRLQRGLAAPFEVADLQREQQILLQDPLVRR